MANNSTISITFKMDADSKGFKDLVASNDGLKRALSSTTTEAGKLSKGLGSLKSMAPLVSKGITEMGVVITKVMKDAVTETQTLGDQWTATFSGLKNVYQQFLGTFASATRIGFGNAFKGFDAKGFFAAGRQQAQAEDDQFEAANAIAIRRSQIRQEQALLQEQVRNQELSAAERKAAAEKYLANIKPIIQDEQKLMKDLWEARSNTFLKGAGLALNDENRKALEAFLAGGAKMSDRIDPTMDALYMQYQKMSDSGISSLTSSLQGYLDSLGAYESENTRMLTMLHSLSAATTKQAEQVKTVEDAIREYNDAIQNAVAVNQALDSSVAPVDTRLHEMESGLRAIIAQYGMEDEKVKALIDHYVKLKQSRELESGALPQLPGITPASGSGGLAGSRPMGEAKAYTDSLKDMQLALGGVSAALGDMGAAMGDNAAQWLRWAAGLLQSIGAALPAIQAVTGAQAASSVAGIPIVGPVMAVASMASVLASFASLPKFADGGIAFGPTVGMFGEYVGASHNPEVVAPLDRLRSLMGDTAGGGGTVEFHIEGRALKGVLQKMNALDSRS